MSAVRPAGSLVSVRSGLVGHGARLADRPAGGPLPEDVLEHLAGGVEGQRVDDLHDAGDLVIGHFVPAPFDDVVTRDVLRDDDEGHAHLTQPVVGDADHRGLLHGGMPQQRVLDLGGVGVEAADDEHVLDPTHDAEPAGLVDLAEVTGAQPAVVRQHLLRLLGVVEVPRHDAAAAEQHFARLPGLDVHAALTDDAQLEPGPWPAYRRGHRLGIVALGRGAGGPGLGEAVAGDDVREGKLLVDPADQLHRDVGRAGHRHAQRREVVLRALRVVEDRLVQRRWTGKDGDTLRRDASQHPVDVEDGLGQHGGPTGDAGQNAGLQAEHVEVRVHLEIDVPGR